MKENARQDFLKLLQRAVQKDASDLHLKTGSKPYFRVDGEIVSQEGEPLRSEDIEGFLRVMLSDVQYSHFAKRGDIDLAFTEKGVGRFRVNAFRQRGNVSIVMRRIKSKILSFDELNLPSVVRRFAEMRRGLVLITGTTGSGMK